MKKNGFSLLEATFAATILVVGVGALAQLVLVSTQANRGSRVTTLASILAQEKMEHLRGLTWGSAEFSPSPVGSLSRNTAGYCDFLDGSGRPLGDGLGSPTPPDGTVFIRRWSVEPLPANPDTTVVLQVDVIAPRDRRLPDESRLVSVRARKAG
jgi:hypothetical protein